MQAMRVSRRQVLKGAGAVGVLGALAGPTAVFAGDDLRVRWDIVSVGTGKLLAGGKASARANDKSRITVTGSGTFVPGEEDEVTGGGTWTTTGAIGAAMGKYVVTELVSFEAAPGTLPPIPDGIGNAAAAHAGLAKLGVDYLNGKRGVLTVSCHLVDTPDSVFEGITASMGSVDFWNREAPSDKPFIDENRTVFHISGEAEKD